jgi:hypothetical protein
VAIEFKDFALDRGRMMLASDTWASTSITSSFASCRQETCDSERVELDHPASSSGKHKNIYISCIFSFSFGLYSIRLEVLAGGEIH